MTSGPGDTPEPDLAAIAADLSESVAALSTASALGLPDLLARIDALKARIGNLETKLRAEIELSD
ncbi:hypothetical protein CHU95_16545 [Niveispirillum lacus]|uniref:Uncharacterized protein n=1 Tax=Niveispirillum lacus TaxID=1981099 RepID=A0A255YT95_9PROT|nr:hypothetical protein [Niveispirillum lacus]OYQ32409.1 hypothetical protein CHU95_16545 [Niveispirillum lacus]